MLQNGFIQKKYGYELKILSKYLYAKYRENKDLDKDKINEKLKQQLIDFCNSHIMGFNVVKNMRLIKNACNYGKSHRLFVVKPVRITQLEFERIKNLHDLTLEKIAFTILVLANIHKQKKNIELKDKIININNQNNVRRNPKSNKEIINDYPKPIKPYYTCDKINYIFKTAKIYLNKQDKNKIIKQLIDKEYIIMTKKCNYKLNYVHHNCNKNALVIDNFDNFILGYEMLIGDNIIKCDVCNKFVRKKSNNQKYCKECWQDIRKEQNKNNFNNWYAKQKSNHLENPQNH